MLSRHSRTITTSVGGFFRFGSLPYKDVYLCGVFVGKDYEAMRRVQNRQPAQVRADHLGTHPLKESLKAADLMSQDR